MPHILDSDFSNFQCRIKSWAEWTLAYRYLVPSAEVISSFVLDLRWDFLEVKTLPNANICPLELPHYLIYFSNCPIASFFFKNLINLFLERGAGREKKREKNINVWLPLMYPLLGTCPATQACALTGNQTHDFWFAGRFSIHWATPAGYSLKFLKTPPGGR